MFRASTWPSSRGQIVLSQHLVSSLSVNSSAVCRMRADCRAVCSHPAYCTVLYREWRYQMLWKYNLSSRRWSSWCSKYVEDCNVTYILLMNKNCALKLVNEISIYKLVNDDKIHAEFHYFYAFSVVKWRMLAILVIFNCSSWTLNCIFL